MARNGSGTYSLATGNPTYTGMTVTATYLNDTLNDIATALSDSLDRNGNGAMLAALKVIDGVLANPGIAFSSEASSGLFRAGAGDVRLALLGALIAKFTAAGLEVSGTVKTSDGAVGAPAIAFNSEATSGLFRAGAGDVRLALLGALLVKFTAALVDFSTGIKATAPTAAAQPGVSGTGGNGGGSGANAGVGVYGAGGTDRSGVAGLGNGTGSGLLGSGGDNGGSGVSGTGGTTGPGGRFIAGGGGAPTRGAVALVPQVAPSGPIDGDMWVETGTNALKVRINGVTKTVTVT